LFSIGILAQGIAIFLVTGGTFFSRFDFDVLAAAMLVAACLWGVWAIPFRTVSVTKSSVTPPSAGSESEGSA
jgi:hypothetical protein